MNKPKKPLLEWMDNGDPDLVPISLCDGASLAASWFGVPLRKEGRPLSLLTADHLAVTPEQIVQASKESGIHVMGWLGYVTTIDLIEWIGDIEVTVTEKSGADNSIRRETTIVTPKGTMVDAVVTPEAAPLYWDGHLVNGEEQLPAFSYLIRRANEVARNDPHAREGITARYLAEVQKWPTAIPLYATLGVPAFAMMSNLYMGSTESLYILADQRELLEELFAVEFDTTVFLAECAAAAGADIAYGAINGLEIFSPDMYQRYFVPQAREMFEKFHSCRLRSWVHTCGRKRELISMGVYEQMGADILETMSPPPLGDIDDLRQAREELGTDVITRGGIGVDLFYGEDLQAMRDRTNLVLDETRGYRHIISDTNDSYPPYLRENIVALIEEVEKSGRILRA